MFEFLIFFYVVKCQLIPLSAIKLVKRNLKLFFFSELLKFWFINALITPLIVWPLLFALSVLNLVKIELGVFINIHGILFELLSFLIYQCVNNTVNSLVIALSTNNLVKNFTFQEHSCNVLWTFKFLHLLTS